MQPTVPWDSKCDVPLERCLKELPAQTDGATAEAEAAEAAMKTAAEGKSEERTADESSSEERTADESSLQQQQWLQPDEWLAGGVDSLPELGTAQVAVWDVNQRQ